ncbi:MAG: helix-hairpin-helix domain-containing protein [Chloroflexi bacterium]|nr:helix-hairpin-helix domain-containing protein [Chloroflexota bacterium]
MASLGQRRTGASVLLLLIITVGAALWLLRQPRSAVTVVAPSDIREASPVAAPVAGRLGQTNRLVDLNTATAEELEALPGIGPVIARRIVEYRARQGAFTSADEVVAARLMPRSTFSRLRDRLTAEEAR